VAKSGRSRLLKVLHVDPERKWGGGEAQVLGLLAYLAQRGHVVHLLAHPEGILWQRARTLKIETLPLKVRNDFDWRPVPALRRMIRKGRYDIVHLHTKRAHALSLWMPRAKEDPKYVVTRRMDYPERRNLYTRYLYNHCVDGVVAISQPIVDLLVDAGVERERIRLIYSGIDASIYRGVSCSSVPRSDRTIVGTIATLEKRKGHPYLFEAACLLKEEGYKLRWRLAGDGSLRATLEAMVARLNLNDVVVFCGFVSDIPNFLSKTDLFVLPSLSEGLGVSVLEAMAAGKAVVASDVGGLSELVVDSATGFLVPPADAKALAAAIGKLLREPTLARAMGRRGAERVAEHFTLDQMAAKNEDYYYTLIEGERAVIETVSSG
jgi:glycosyltransferase involved in cell wall biosynthesis